MDNTNQNLDILSNDETVKNIAWESLKQSYNTPAMISLPDDIILRRTAICHNCEKYDKASNTCTVTGQDITTKNRIIPESCPIGKWSDEKEYWLLTVYPKVIQSIKNK